MLIIYGKGRKERMSFTLEGSNTPTNPIFPYHSRSIPIWFNVRQLFGLTVF